MEEFFSKLAKVKHEVMMQEKTAFSQLSDNMQQILGEIRRNEIGFLLPYYYRAHSSDFPDRSIAFDDQKLLSKGRNFSPMTDDCVLCLYSDGTPFFVDFHIRDFMCRGIIFGLELNQSGTYDLKISPFTCGNEVSRGGLLQLCGSIQAITMTPISKVKLFTSILPRRFYDNNLVPYEFNEADNIEGNPDFIGLTGFYLNLRKEGLGIEDFTTYVFNPLKEFSTSFMDAYSAYVLKIDEDDMLLYGFEDSTELLQQLKAMCRPASPLVVAIAAASANDDD